MFGTISSKKIAILGFSFKSNTNDTRESPAIYICKKLIEEGANLKIFDPKVSEQQIGKDLEVSIETKNNSELFGKWTFSNSLYKTFVDADAAIFMTEWEDFQNLSWEKIAPTMRKPAWIFDTRSILKIDEIKDNGLNVWQVGCVA